MTDEKRLIAEALKKYHDAAFTPGVYEHSIFGKAALLLDQNTVEVPCKIGDFVWAIRNFHGHKHPQRGIVSDIYFLKDMSLQIVVKYVARGKWGETVFATDKEAYAAIGERKDNG